MGEQRPPGEERRRVGGDKGTPGRAAPAKYSPSSWSQGSLTELRSQDLAGKGGTQAVSNCPPTQGGRDTGHADTEINRLENQGRENQGWEPGHRSAI